tara:strand:- start:468 stop:635 length:168 start_codon:yes stop_codon:yes gene_type:complete
MSEKDFIQWLKGFAEGVHHYNVSPKQWDYLKQKLEQVKTEPIEYRISERWTTTNT